MHSSITVVHAAVNDCNTLHLKKRWKIISSVCHFCNIWNVTNLAKKYISKKIEDFWTNFDLVIALSFVWIYKLCENHNIHFGVYHFWRSTYHYQGVKYIGIKINTHGIKHQTCSELVLFGCTLLYLCSLAVCVLLRDIHT